MQHTQKYCLVTFLKPLEVGAEFAMSEWPLHVTLADVFAVDLHGTALANKLEAVLAKEPSFSVSAGDDATLGTTPVVLLRKSKEIVSLHTTLVDLLESNGATFNSPTFTKDGFLPHCTIQESGRLEPGDVLSIEAAYLVDMFPNGDWRQRKILASFRLLPMHLKASS